MKKFLKFLGVTAAAAALIPCKVEKDEETGVTTVQSLLSKLRVGPGENGEGTDIRVDALGGLIPSALSTSGGDDPAGEEDFDDLDSYVTEPMFEVNVKLERDVPAQPEEAGPKATAETAETPEAPAAGEEAEPEEK